MFLGCGRLCMEKTGKARKVSFVITQVVHFIFVLSILYGAFSRHFANGGIQILAYTVMNLYVYLLCALNYPVTIYIKEYEVAEDRQNLTGEI